MIIRITKFISESFMCLLIPKTMQLSLLLFLITSFSFAQAGKDGALTVSTNNTVLNRYSRVIVDVIAGTNTATVTDINELYESSTALTNYLSSGYNTNTSTYTSNAFAVGDLIMLYQLQKGLVTFILLDSCFASK